MPFRHMKEPWDKKQKKDLNLGKILTLTDQDQLSAFVVSVPASLELCAVHSLLIYEKEIQNLVRIEKEKQELRSE